MSLILLWVLIGEGPDHLPTPYTANQIREAHPEGAVVTAQMVRSDGTTVLLRTVFHDHSEQGTAFTTEQKDPLGNLVGQPQTNRASWEELRQHAIFPRETTRRSESTVTTALGTQACWKYEVNDNQTRRVMWFSKSHPGAPVLMEEYLGEELQYRIETTSIIHPH